MEGIKKLKNMMELPNSMGDISLEINSNKELLLSGANSILEYSENAITIATRDFPLRIMGGPLVLKHLSGDDIVIKGCIVSIEFLV